MLKIIFECGWDERDDFETPLKGHRNDVIVLLPNGKKYKLFFVDPNRLSQEMEEKTKKETIAFFAEPNLIIVSEVNKRNIEQTAQKLFEISFYEEIMSI